MPRRGCAERERRNLEILSVKKEAKLSASEVDEVEIGTGDADLRWSGLLTGLLVTGQFLRAS